MDVQIFDRSMQDLQEGLWLAGLSTLTYEDAIESRAPAFGISELEIIRPNDQDIPILAIVGVVEDRVFVAYRGTVFAGWSENLDQWKEMFLGMLVNCGGVLINDDDLLRNVERLYGGKAHIGFTELFESIWPRVKKSVDTRTKKGERKLWFTGHSLGGALATLAAYRMFESPKHVPIVGVYTFGSPRVFDEQMYDRYKDKQFHHFRFENRNDIVPLLPPGPILREPLNALLDRLFGDVVRLHAVDYKHTGSLRYINASNEIENETPLLPVTRAWNLSKALLGNLRSLAGDHSILNYQQALAQLLHGDVALTPDRTTSVFNCTD